MSEAIVESPVTTAYKQILFSTPMVQAILEGRKTVTRRTVKMKEGDLVRSYMAWGPNSANEKTVACAEFRMPNSYGEVVPYRIHIGDVIWIRETWKPHYVKGGLDGFRLQYPGVHPWFYAADGESPSGYGPWKPSIHMPREACRLFLEVTDVRVSRLQEITHAQVRDEGVVIDLHRYYDAQAQFKELWDSINGAGSWEGNPYVWEIHFKRLAGYQNPWVK